MDQYMISINLEGIWPFCNRDVVEGQAKNIYIFKNQSNFLIKAFSSSPHILMCSWFSDYCSVKSEIL